MTDSSNPFDRVKAAADAGNDTNAVRPKADGESAMPVPTDAPGPPDRHPSKGRWSACWTYRDATGAVLGHVVRIDGDDGKQVLPLTCWREAGALRWRWKGFADPRPLYGLDQLAKAPTAPVLVVEGEKTADATRERFPGFAVVTWPGGSKATGKVDWTPLAGREVIIFPDADAPGRKAADDVARHASAIGADSVAVVNVPTFLPEGWDLADNWTVGFGLADATTAIEEARFKGIAGGVELPTASSWTRRACGSMCRCRARRARNSR